jgi:hypothetical protein
LLVEKDAVDVFLLVLQMVTSVEMIRKHYGHVNILNTTPNVKIFELFCMFGLAEN